MPTRWSSFASHPRTTASHGRCSMRWSRTPNAIYKLLISLIGSSILFQVSLLRVHTRHEILMYFSPFEISTSLWASLHHYFTVLSVFSHVSSQLIFVHIFPGVVNPSPSMPPPSSLLLMCPYQFNLFCLRNVGIL